MEECIHNRVYTWRSVHIQRKYKTLKIDIHRGRYTQKGDTRVKEAPRLEVHTEKGIYGRRHNEERYRGRYTWNGSTHSRSKRRIFGSMPESKAKSMEVAIEQNHDKGLVGTRASI